eukprot:scaffold28459_cov48-Prasinocladus_malaysianus.AAC.1
MVLLVSKDLNARVRLHARALRPLEMRELGAFAFPSVAELDLSRVPHVTDKGFEAFVLDSGKSQLPPLKTLCLKRAKALTVASFALVARMETISSLNLALCYGLNDDSLIQIGTGLCCLEYLSIRGCHQVSDAGIVGFAEKATGLLSLNISGCRAGVTDVSARAIATHIKRLVELK